MSIDPLLPTTVVQDFLRKSRKYDGAIDGMYGPESQFAARRYVATHASARTGYAETWSDARVRIAMEQTILAASQLYPGPVDGIAGSMTRAAAESRNAEGAGRKVMAAMVGAAVATFFTMMLASAGGGGTALAATTQAVSRTLIG